MHSFKIEITEHKTLGANNHTETAVQVSCLKQISALKRFHETECIGTIFI